MRRYTLEYSPESSCCSYRSNERALSLSAEEEIKNLIVGGLVTVRTGEKCSASSHFRFERPGKGVAELARRSLYLFIGELAATFGAADDPSWHNGLHPLEYHTGGKEVIRRELERPVGCCAFPEGALAESVLQEGEAAHLKRHLFGVGRKN